MKTQVRVSQRINILLALQRHYKGILLIGTLSFALTGALAFFVLTKPSYSCSVELRIDPTTDTVVPGVDYSSSNSMAQFYSAYVATQKYKIIKRQNVEKAIRSLDPSLQRALIGDRPLSPGVLDQIVRSIVILPSYDSLITVVTFTGEKATGLAEFLNALIGVYLEELKAEKTNLESNRIGFAEKQKGSLQDQIKTITQRIQKISEETATGNFAAEDIPFRNEFKIQEETSLRAENDRVMKENVYNQFVSQMSLSIKLETDARAEEKMKADSVLASKKKALISRQDLVTSQMSSTLLEPGALEQLKAEAVSIQRQLLDLDKTYRDRYRSEVADDIKIAYEKQRLTLSNEFLVAKQYEMAVKKSFASIQEKYSLTSRKILEAQQLQQDLAVLKTQADKVNTNLTYFQGEQQANGHVNVESFAKTPSAQDKSGLTKNLLFAFVFSYGWIVALFFVLEIFDGRVKSAQELKSFSGIKPSWPISHYPNNFKTVFQQTDENVVKKAIRSLATRINRERQDFQAKVVVFTGVNSRVGCTEILLNCAQAMTDNCGSVLVIDMNKDSPGIAMKLGILKRNLPTAKELEVATLESAISRDSNRGFDVLAVQNPERIENKTMERIIALARERYDVVFLDSAPILQSSVTEFLFPESDLAVFIVLGNKSTYTNIGHSLELAQKLGVQSASLVLNWWHPDPKEEKYQESLEPS